MNEGDKIPLAHLARELTLLTGGQPPKNRKLWEMIVDNQIPAQQVSGRWFIERADLPAIAEILRLAEIARPVSKRIRTSAAA